MTLPDIFGTIGTLLSSATFVPQVYQAWKTKSVGDLSIWMIILLFGNVSSWLTYAVLLHLAPMIVANSIILALAFLMLYFKLTFTKK